ncbi:MAG: tRNA (adenosine(37)-N6)-threonylcarbamoyltransferase complex ATPase subunit type 1 TsaE [Alistipes sp.]|jgi:tRNA threonylcarbamoyladenosine biosynthesis protein TsaE|nr:tRNA (adenosine(37)-N6)-threonylcarbamoyltransferase complex ATPase subunit type 1 TsaE [Alistipes sp.]
MKQIKIDSLSELSDVAREIIESLQGRTVVLFRGEMGAGKTTLISRIVEELGAEDNVTSPTFAIVNQYEGTECRIYHFDFYRIERLEEAYDFGYEEYFYSGDLCLVEWPEKIEPLLPEDAMQVMIRVVDEDSRIFEIE